MNPADFKKSLSEEKPSEGLPVFLKALWYDAKGDWETAHSLINDNVDKPSAWVHAYLHRKEGDNMNARYWYSIAEKVFPKTELNEEWESLLYALK